MSDEIRFVLINTSHPGNIGAVARAMKNMCLDRLALVSPRQFPSAEATARASGADDLLAGATCHESLDDAIADCQLVIGASARRRSVDWPELTPRECALAARAAAAHGPVAILFGREDSGLSNEELSRCQHLVRIPSNAEFSSLNIAMAAQIIAYELLLTTQGANPPEASNPTAEVATGAEMAGLFEHLHQAIVDIGFADVRQSTKLMQRLRRLFQRARPDRYDINILRGILSAAQGRKSMRRPGN